MTRKIREQPDIQLTGKMLLNSVGIRIRKTMSGIKFVYKQETIDELKQLGFSIDILKVKGGSMPLPLLRRHVDEQATLEAYWSAQAEGLRYKLSVAQDNYNFWYEAKYARCFVQLQNRGIPKPTKAEVDARISLKFPKDIRKRKERVRKLEHLYRILHNACYVSVVTKGKMLQTLRNVIMGGTYKAPSIENEVIGNDISNMRVGQEDRMSKEEKPLKKNKMPSLTSMKVTKEAVRKYAESDEWYKAEFVKAEPGKGQFGPYVKLTFKLLGGQCEDGDSAKGLTINTMMNMDLALNSPLYKFACVFLGKKLAEDDDVDFTSFYGEKYRAFVTDKPNKKNDGKRYQMVKTIKQLKKA